MKHDLSNPSNAREYIAQFEIPGAPGKPTYIETNTGKRIEFATMTDEEACVVAYLLHDLVIEAGRRVIKH